MEELLLGLGLALQELDVVDEEHVHVAVAALEPVLPVVADRLMNSLVNSSLETYLTFAPL